MKVDPLALFASLGRSTFGKDVLLVVTGTGLGQFIVLLATPVITRLYSPDEFGVLGLYTAVITMLVTVASLRYELAIPLPKSEEAAIALVVLSCGVLLVASLLVGTISGVFSTRIWPESTFAQYWWVVPIGLLAAGFYQVLSYAVIRDRAFHLVARTRLKQSLALAGVQIVLGMIGAGAAGLLTGDIIGRAAGSGSLARETWRSHASQLRAVRWREVQDVAYRYRDFPLVSSGSAFLNIAGLQIPAVLILAFFGAESAGLFALAQRVIAVPMRLIGRSVSQVYLGEAARVWRERPDELLPLYNKVSRKLFIIGTPLILALALAAPLVFGRVFGEEWRPAGAFVLLLSPMFIGQFIVSPVSQTAMILERQGIQLLVDAIRLVLVILALAGSYVLNAPPWAAVLALSAATTVMYVAYYFVYRTLLESAATHGALPGS